LKKNILIVGAGGIGIRHIRCFLKTKRCQIYVCEPRSERVKEIKQKYPIKDAFKDFATINLRDFNGVVICTPPNLHIPMAQKCAEEGVHFLLEKPLSLDLKGVKELKATIKNKGIVAGVAYVYRNYKSIVRLKQRVDSGEIGTVKMVNSFCGSDYRKYRPDYRDIYYAKRSMGGGCILDTLSHHINLVEMFLGKEKEVCAIYDQLEFEGVECEDSAAVISRFKKGEIASYTINQFQKPYVNTLEFVGTKGNLRWQWHLNKGAKIYFCDSDENIWEKEDYFEERDEGYITQANNFLDAMEKKCRIATTIEEAEQTLKVCLAAFKSGKEGKFQYII